MGEPLEGAMDGKQGSGCPLGGGNLNELWDAELGRLVFGSLHLTPVQAPQRREGTGKAGGKAKRTADCLREPQPMCRRRSRLSGNGSRCQTREPSANLH